MDVEFGLWKIVDVVDAEENDQDHPLDPDQSQGVAHVDAEIRDPRASQSLGVRAILNLDPSLDLVLNLVILARSQSLELPRKRRKLLDPNPALDQNPEIKVVPVLGLKVKDEIPVPVQNLLRKMEIVQEMIEV